MTGTSRKADLTAISQPGWDVTGRVRMACYWGLDC